MERDLEGKVAVISGGSRGIGRAIARRFALDGADCVVAARNESALTSAAQELARDSGRRIEICPADLRTLTGCEKVYRTVEERFGRLDVLVNNVGATKAGSLLDLEDAVWEDGFTLKFYACVRLSRLFWPMLTQSRGCVVNIVGGFARTPDPVFMVGGAVNAAMANFTKTLAGLGKRDDVNVNAVYPGLTETQRVHEIFATKARQAGVSPEDMRRIMIDKEGIRRIGQPEDVANLVAFLCSPGARHVQGTAIAVDGGRDRGTLLGLPTVAWKHELLLSSDVDLPVRTLMKTGSADFVP